MRYLYFDRPNASLLYEMLYDAIINSPKGYDKSEVRVISKVYDKFEAIGMPTERNGKMSYGLTDPLGSIKLEDAELNLVNSALAPIRWLGTHARLATELLDWLADLPTEERKDAASS